MRPGAQKFLNGLKLVLGFGWVRKIRENRQAVRRGEPKPHDPKEIAGDVLKSAFDVADTVKGRRK